MPSSRSPLQNQVLSLYRRSLRAAASKPNRETWLSYVREEFRAGAKAVKRTEFRTIEYMLRCEFWYEGWIFHSWEGGPDLLLRSSELTPKLPNH